MRASKILVILILLFIILVLFVNELGYKENFFNNGEQDVAVDTIYQIKYHIVPDFIPEINGIKYYNYLTKKTELDSIK